MPTRPSHLLVLGGVRSGKTAFAERRAAGSGRVPVYIATAEPCDDEMAARIAAHRAARGSAWRTIEAPLDLVPTLLAESRPDRALVVDCLTLWLTNLLLAERDLDAAAAELVAATGACAGPLALVSNELGLGGVAATAMGRRFADATGRLHQLLAAAVPEVVLVAAGLPLWLKGPAEQGAAACT